MKTPQKYPAAAQHYADVRDALEMARWHLGLAAQVATGHRRRRRRLRELMFAAHFFCEACLRRDMARKARVRKPRGRR